MNEQLLDVELPKWPQFIVMGRQLPEALARDIIERTDSFLYDLYGWRGGNAKAFNERYRQQVTAGVDLPSDWRHLHVVDYELKAAAGVVELQYLYNRWASSAYVFGPCGFVSPRGLVRFTENLGKWPSAQAVYEDLEAVAAAWPTLEFRATLYSGEHSEEHTHPVISFEVVGGRAIVLETPIDLREELEITVDNETQELVSEYETKWRERDIVTAWDPQHSRELGLPAAWYPEIAAKYNKLLRGLSSLRLE